MNGNISFNREAREKLQKGINALANSVRVTLGPKGRNVIIQNNIGVPQITKDGVTVAKRVELEDVVENMGAQMLREVASKTADLAGDGTTTATVLAQAMVNAGLKNVTAGANPMDLKRGMDKATKLIVDELAHMSEIVGDDFEKIKQVASISANNDEEIGELIANAMKTVSNNGVVTVEESQTTETFMEEVVGMQFDRGLLSPHFITDADVGVAEYDNPLILLTENKIMSMRSLIPILDKVSGVGRPLLIIADDFSSPVLSSLIDNRLRSGLPVVPVKAPGFAEDRAEQLEDIGVLTGAIVLSEINGYTLENIGLEHLGSCGRLTVSPTATVIVDGEGDEEELVARVKKINHLFDTTGSDFDRKLLQERLAKLAGGVAVLHVGAASEVEMKEKKDRVDDALHATRAAIEEGIVVGGGVALVRAIEVLKKVKGSNEDEHTGIQIIIKALEAPLRVIANNAGIEGSVVLHTTLSKKGNIGYNARHDRYEDLKKAGIIDPTKVTRVALENACSIAGLILTTECVLTNLNKAWA